jgi:hypothetical protein
VTTADISNSNGVRSEDVLDDTAKLGGLAANDLAPGSVGTSEVLNDTVAGGGLAAADLGPSSVGSSELTNGSVGSAEFANSSIIGGFGGAVFDDSLTAHDLALNSVLNSELGVDAVQIANMANNSVGQAEIRSSAVASDEISNGAVGASELDVINTRTSVEVVPAGLSGTTQVIADCNAGEVVISGGADWDPSRYHTRIIESRRLDSNSWFVRGYYGDGPGLAEEPPSVNLEAEAYCLAL